MYTYKALIEKVLDGDTADALIDLGFDVHIKQRLRFFGVDTPEVHTKDSEEKARGLEVKQFVVDAIEGKEVELTTEKKGKFGRYLANIFVDGNNLNKMLLEKGMAKEYYGGKK